MPRTALDRFEQRKLTRAKLVDAALKLFSTSGYEHATVDDISQEAGYSKGAYYFHFSTKDDILMELLRMWTTGRTAILEGGPDGDGGLRVMLAEFFSYEGTPQWPAVLLEFWAQAVRNKDVSGKLSQAYASWRKLLGEAFAAAGESGELRSSSGEDAAAVVLAAHDGLAVQVAIGSPGGRAMTARELADSIITPLEAPAEVERRASAR